MYLKGKKPIRRIIIILIRETGEFVANIPTADMAEIADGCGMVSGRDLQKFEHYGLTPERGTLEFAPFIAECPLNVEFRVKQLSTWGAMIFSWQKL